MPDLSHLDAGDLVAIPAPKIWPPSPDFSILKISRATKATLFCSNPQGWEYSINKKTGRIKGSYDYAVEATASIQEKNKEQTAAYERRAKAHKKFLQIIQNKGYNLSTESLEILGEAWDRCEESKAFKPLDS